MSKTSLILSRDRLDVLLGFASDPTNGNDEEAISKYQTTNGIKVEVDEFGSRTLTSTNGKMALILRQDAIPEPLESYPKVEGVFPNKLPLVSVLLDPDQIRKVLEAFAELRPADNILMDVHGPEAPIILRSDDDRFRAAVMPMAIPKDSPFYKDPWDGTPPKVGEIPFDDATEKPADPQPTSDRPDAADAG